MMVLLALTMQTKINLTLKEITILTGFFMAQKQVVPFIAEDTTKLKE